MDVLTEKELEKLYKAVANRRRIAIIRHIRSQGSETVGAIAKAIKLSFKSTSRHLQVLVGAGYLAAEQQGLYMYYMLKPQSETATRITRLL